MHSQYVCQLPYDSKQVIILLYCTLVRSAELHYLFHTYAFSQLFAQCTDHVYRYKSKYKM